MAITINHTGTKNCNQIALLIIVMMFAVYPVSYALGFATGLK